MSATTRTLGFNWLVKFCCGGTCTACSTDADAVRLSGATCTNIGGMDNIDFGGTKEMIDVTAFEDTINKNVPGRVSLDAINFAGNYDTGCTASKQRYFLRDIFHQNVCASSSPVRWISATDTVNKRIHFARGYTSSVKIGIPVKGKGTFSFSLLPISKVQVCTLA
jgi:hypothetical protein